MSKKEPDMDKMKEILKAIREKEENEEYEGLHQVNNLEQGKEMLDMLGNMDKDSTSRKKINDETNQVIVELMSYPIASLIGTAIMYGQDINNQFGIVDGEKLIQQNKLASLKGVLLKLQSLN